MNDTIGIKSGRRVRNMASDVFPVPLVVLAERIIKSADEKLECYLQCVRQWCIFNFRPLHPENTADLLVPFLVVLHAPPSVFRAAACKLPLLQFGPVSPVPEGSVAEQRRTAFHKSQANHASSGGNGSHCLQASGLTRTRMAALPYPVTLQNLRRRI